MTAHDRARTAIAGAFRNLNDPAWVLDRVRREGCSIGLSDCGMPTHPIPGGALAGEVLVTCTDAELPRWLALSVDKHEAAIARLLWFELVDSIVADLTDGGTDHAHTATSTPASPVVGVDDPRSGGRPSARPSTAEGERTGPAEAGSGAPASGEGR